MLEVGTSAQGDDLLEVGDIDLQSLISESEEREEADEAENGGMVQRVHSIRQPSAREPLQPALDVQKVAAEVVIGGEPGVDGEEVVRGGGSGREIIRRQSTACGVERAGPIERRLGAREAASALECAASRWRTREEAPRPARRWRRRVPERGGVGGGEREERRGGAEGRRRRGRGRGGGRERVEAGVEGALVGDALVEEAGGAPASVRARRATREAGSPKSRDGAVSVEASGGSAASGRGERGMGKG